MKRTFVDHRNHPHTLDLDTVQVDGLALRAILAEGKYVMFSTPVGTVTCVLERLWQDIAGAPLTACEAGALLMECLARQILLDHQRVLLDALTEILSQRDCSEASSLGWLTTRLDPLAAKAMAAYDGTPEMTAMLARILQSDPATTQHWAQQLGLATPLPTHEVHTGPLVRSDMPECTEASAAKLPFSWTPERRTELEKALQTCAAPTVVERARQIAAAYDWPEASVRSKLYEMQRPHRGKQPGARETEGTEAEKEGDQRVLQREIVGVL